VNVLGINSVYHESAAALLVAGTLVAAVEEDGSIASSTAHRDILRRRAISVANGVKRKSRGGGLSQRPTLLTLIGVRQESWQRIGGESPPRGKD
jgi:hypothetical protein